MGVGTTQTVNLESLHSIVENKALAPLEKVKELDARIKETYAESTTSESALDLKHITNLTNILLDFVENQIPSEEECKSSKNTLFRHLLLNKLIKITRKNVKHGKELPKVKFLRQQIFELSKGPDIPLNVLLNSLISIINFYRDNNQGLPNAKESELLNDINNFIEHCLSDKKNAISQRNMEQLAKLNVQSYHALHNSLSLPSYKCIPVQKTTARVSEIEKEVSDFKEFFILYHKADTHLWENITNVKTQLPQRKLTEKELAEIVKYHHELQDLQAYLEKNLIRLNMKEQQRIYFRERTFHLTTIVNDFIRSQKGWAHQDSKTLIDILVPIPKKDFNLWDVILDIARFIFSWLMTEDDIIKSQVKRNKSTEEILKQYRNATQINVSVDNSTINDSLTKEYTKAVKVNATNTKKDLAHQNAAPKHVQQTVSLINLKDELNQMLSSDPANQVFLSFKRKIKDCNDLPQLIHLTAEILGELNNQKATKPNVSNEKLTNLCYQINSEFYKQEIKNILISEPKNTLYVKWLKEVEECKDLGQFIDLALKIINELHQRKRQSLTIADEQIIAICYQAIHSDSSSYVWLKHYIKTAEANLKKLFNQLTLVEKHQNESQNLNNPSQKIYDEVTCEGIRRKIKTTLDTLTMRHHKLKMAQTKVLHRIFDIHDKYRARLHQLDRVIKNATLAFKLDHYREQRKTDYAGWDAFNPSANAPDSKEDRLATAERAKNLVLEAKSPEQYSELFTYLDAAIADVNTKTSRLLRLLFEINNTLFEILNNKSAITHKNDKKQQILMNLEKSDLIFLEHCLGVLSNLRPKKITSNDGESEEANQIVKSNSRHYRDIRTTRSFTTPEIFLQKVENIFSSLTNPYTNNSYTKIVRSDYTHIKIFLNYLENYHHFFQEENSAQFLNQLIDEAKTLYHNIEDEEVKYNLSRFIRAIGTRYIDILSLPNAFVHFDNKSKEMVNFKINNFHVQRSKTRVLTEVKPHFADDVNLREFCDTLFMRIEDFMLGNKVMASGLFTPNPTAFQTASITIGALIGMPIAAIFDAAALHNRFQQFNDAEIIASKIQSVEKIPALARKLAQTITTMYWYQLKRVVDPLEYVTLIECFMERTTDYLKDPNKRRIGTVNHFISTLHKSGITHNLIRGFGRKNIALQNSDSIEAWKLIENAPVVVKKGERYTMYRNAGTLLYLGPVIMPAPPKNFWPVKDEKEMKVIFGDSYNFSQYQEEYKTVQREISEFYKVAAAPLVTL